MEKNLRIHVRTTLTSNVKITHPDIGSVIVKTKDISDGGICILSLVDNMPPVGSKVKVQLVDMPFEAPTLDMEVIRISPKGIGLKFIGPQLA